MEFEPLPQPTLAESLKAHPLRRGDVAEPLLQLRLDHKVWPGGEGGHSRVRSQTTPSMADAMAPGPASRSRATTDS